MTSILRDGRLLSVSGISPDCWIRTYRRTDIKHLPYSSQTNRQTLKLGQSWRIVDDSVNALPVVWHLTLSIWPKHWWEDGARARAVGAGRR
jgi:hypothetical protein